MRFLIARSHGRAGETHYDTFEVEVKKGDTVLDVLFRIQDEHDPSLAFRYSCRGAVCGSCAMLINKQPQLACRTQVMGLGEKDMHLRPFPAIETVPPEWSPAQGVLVEPLPNLPVLKDLVVDMRPFFRALRDMELWAAPAQEPRTQGPEGRARIQRYLDCIMCAICYGSCPVNAEHSDYVGPAALAKALRFYADSRVTDRQRFLDAALAPNAAPMCELIMNCVRACPKGVAPGGAIRQLKALGHGHATDTQ